MNESHNNKRLSEKILRLMDWAEKAILIIPPDAPLRWYKNDRVRDELRKAIDDLREEYDL